MKKTYRLLALYFGGDALTNEFHDEGGFATFEEAEKAITKTKLEYYDLILIVPAYSRK